MNLREYQENTKRTLPDLGSYQLNIDHMIFGMSSELIEIIDAKDKVNLSEEFADILWYLSNYCNFTNIKIAEYYDFDILPQLSSLSLSTNDTFLRLVSNISKLTNLEKRELAYKKIVNAYDRITSVFDIFKAINDCFVVHNIDPYEAMEKNINKLKVRYPEKFTENLALNRNLETERKILEK